MNNNMINKCFYTDRQPLSTLPVALTNVMKLNGLIPPNMVYIHFCGVILYDNNLAIFLPRNSKIDEGSNTDNVSRNLLRSINKYTTTLKNTVENSDRGDEVIGFDSLNLIISLLDDYRNNGIYVRRMKQEVKNSGRVNWRKTINKTTAICTSDNNIYYPETLGNRQRYLSNSETSRIHAHVIRNLCQQIGWVTFNEPSIPERELMDFPSPLGNKIDKISTLY
ncbi:LlaJI family restriction endonuclease, partial [Rahnella sp. BCC 1045]|uniref:LlaJI family restriction endonuclease n=1 Tax=Rahnella sp. BCC 1045 TaxID=2816251 RepID=UPI001C2647A5